MIELLVCLRGLEFSEFVSLSLQLLAIRDELFDTFRKRHKGVMETEEVQLTQDSLHRLIFISLSFSSLLLYICVHSSPFIIAMYLLYSYVIHLSRGSNNSNQKYP